MSSKVGDEVDFSQRLRKRNLNSVWPQNSANVVKEMIISEQKYVTDLDNIVKVSLMWSNA